MDPEQWLAVHGDILFRYARARVDDHATAEDLVQETLLAAIKGRDGFRGESAERTWLISILRNKLADHLRRRSRELPIGADAEGDAVVDARFDHSGHFRTAPAAWSVTDGAIEQQEFWTIFNRCRDALPPRQAAVFTLRVLEDAATEQVCQDLGLSETNLCVMLHRARLRLRACIEQHWFAAGGDAT